MNFFHNIVKEKIIIGKSSNIHNTNALNIAFGIDENFVIGMGVLMYSMLKHSNKTLVFHIFTDNILPCDIDRIKELINNHTNASAIIYKINPQNFYKLHTHFTWSHAMYYRFLVQECLDPLPKKVLYLDADIICLRDFEEIFSIKNDKVICAVAEDNSMVKYAKKSFSFEGEKYFNSGMLMINTEDWQKNDISNKAIKLLNEFQYKYCDQDVLNKLLYNKTKFIDKKYNNIYHMAADTHTIDENTIFLHLSGSVKPWQEWGKYHPLTKMWLKYMKESPWQDFEIIKPRTYKQAKFMARQAKRSGHIVESIVWYLKYATWKIVGRK